MVWCRGRWLEIRLFAADGRVTFSLGFVFGAGLEADFIDAFTTTRLCTYKVRTRNTLLNLYFTIHFVRNNDSMSSNSHRINTGIESLVRRLCVKIPGEDPASQEERELNAQDFVREVLER